MKTYKLPNDLNLNPVKDFLIYNYKTEQEANKQQVSLKMNTFSFLLKGQKEVFCNKTPIIIDNSSFLLMKKGNCLMTEKLALSNSTYQSLLFFVSDQAIQQFIIQNKISPTSNNKVIYSFKYDSFLEKFVSGLSEICELKPVLQEKLLIHKFEELMIYLIATHNDHFLSSFTKSQTNQHQLTSIVEGNKHQKLSLKELAFLCNMSISTFKREFQKIYHQSPSKWFQEKRLEHAQFLLQKERPSDIYEQIGYESLSNFTQAFKTKYGITPKQYQKT